ncbi:MAG: peptide deformylase [Erysipelothrix sp.]|nr:peptide deformylase [Erysipelothrix sp.]
MNINIETIIVDPHPLLRVKSVDVPLPLSSEDYELAMALIKYVRDSKDPVKAEEEKLKPAVGIAAPQIGINKKIFAVSVDMLDENDEVESIEYLLVNPKLIAHSKRECALKSGEGCLSIEEPYDGFVYRYERVTFKAFDVLTNQEIIIKESDYVGIVLQHEYDHLLGVLFYDRINKNDPWSEKVNATIID